MKFMRRKVKGNNAAWKYVFVWFSFQLVGLNIFIQRNLPIYYPK